MTTPLVMLALLAGPYLLATALGLAADKRHAAGVLGLGLMFVFTGVGHFIKTAEMAQMLPTWVPGRIPLIYATGVLEIALAAALAWSDGRRAIGWALIAVLIGFLPCNVYAALARVPLGGHAWGPVYLALRVPLQMAVIAWTWWFTVHLRQVAEDFQA